MASMRAELPGDSDAWVQAYCEDEDRTVYADMAGIKTVAEFEALVKEARKFVEKQLGEGE